MENSEQQTKIINLGKLLVSELGLENSTDTLSRWMAHYLAEKITTIESFPIESETSNVKKDCFDTILKLWQHRWSMPSDKRPLRNFDPILKTLEGINSENQKPFYYNPFENQDTAEIEGIKYTLDDLNVSMKVVSMIDKVARIWIEDILEKATSIAKDEKTDAIIENAGNISDEDDDINAIKLILEYNSSEETNTMNDYRKRILKKRIIELEKFAKLNKVLLHDYKRELKNLEKNQE